MRSQNNWAFVAIAQTRDSLSDGQLLLSTAERVWPCSQNSHMHYFILFEKICSVPSRDLSIQFQSYMPNYLADIIRHLRLNTAKSEPLIPLRISSFPRHPLVSKGQPPFHCLGPNLQGILYLRPNPCCSQTILQPLSLALFWVSSNPPICHMHCSHHANPVFVLEYYHQPLAGLPDSPFAHLQSNSHHRHWGKTFKL